MVNIVQLLRNRAAMNGNVMPIHLEIVVMCVWKIIHLGVVGKSSVMNITVVGAIIILNTIVGMNGITGITLGCVTAGMKDRLIHVIGHVGVDTGILVVGVAGLTIGVGVAIV